MRSHVTMTISTKDILTCKVTYICNVFGYFLVLLNTCYLMSYLPVPSTLSVTCRLMSLDDTLTVSSVWST